MRSLSKILVTGGAGFIGSHLVDRLLSEEAEVIVLDNFSTGRMQNISHHRNTKGLHVIHGDVRDAEVVKSAVEDVDAVFHEAALVDVALSAEKPFLFNDVNVVGTLNLLRACADSGIRRFVFASSAAVYGNSGPAKKRENMPLDPISPYGVTKLAAENYVRIFGDLYGLETVSLRCFNVYGRRQGLRSGYSGVITAFLSRLWSNRAPVIHGDGKQTRDFVNVGDVVSANILALKSKNAVGEVFNVASGRAMTIGDLAGILQRITNKEHLKPIFAEPRIGDIKHCLADISKAERLLGFHPEVKIGDGLLRLVQYHRDARHRVQ